MFGRDIEKHGSDEGRHRDDRRDCEGAKGHEK
jgi:hypothetical protein